ncbi:MAG TPA: MBL fold metallo-hydrolase [Solirubrobacterales bacterium]|jgi:glyoxylase-like metal-dependent hydrolase (beta-lactamase superfamily II)
MATATDAPALDYAHLRPTTAEPMPFAPELDMRAFLIERDAGNLLVYSTGTLAGDAGWLTDAGVERQYLNHWHESIFGLAPEELGARLVVHRDDAKEVAERGREPITFDRRFQLDDDFEAIPIPGHTPGATAYLWDSGEHRFLFTGDSVYVHRGRWRVALLDSSDRESYIESLELLRDVDFDVLVPWIAGRGEAWAVAVSAEERRARFDKLIAYLRDRA